MQDVVRVLSAVALVIGSVVAQWEKTRETTPGVASAESLAMEERLVEVVLHVHQVNVELVDLEQQVAQALLLVGPGKDFLMGMEAAQV